MKPSKKLQLQLTGPLRNLHKTFTVSNFTGGHKVKRLTNLTLSGPRLKKPAPGTGFLLEKDLVAIASKLPYKPIYFRKAEK